MLLCELTAHRVARHVDGAFAELRIGTREVDVLEHAERRLRSLDVGPIRLHAVRADANDLATLDLAKVLRADGSERARFRSDDVPVLAQTADAERTHAPRIAKRVELVLGTEHDRVRSARLSENRLDAVEHRSFRLDDQLR